MAKLHKLQIPANTWVPIYSDSDDGIAVGTSVLIQNISTSWIKITELEENEIPDIEDDLPCNILTNVDKPYATAEILKGSGYVFVKPYNSDRSAVITIQEV